MLNQERSSRAAGREKPNREQEESKNPPCRFQRETDKHEQVVCGVPACTARTHQHVRVRIRLQLRGVASVVALQEHASDEPFEAWNADAKRRTTPHAEWSYVVDCTERSVLPSPTAPAPQSLSLNITLTSPRNFRKHHPGMLLRPSPSPHVGTVGVTVML